MQWNLTNADTNGITAIYTIGGLKYNAMFANSITWNKHSYMECSYRYHLMQNTMAVLGVFYRVATHSLTDYQEQTNKFSGSYVILVNVHEIENICI